MQLVYIAQSVVPSDTANSIHVVKMAQALALNGAMTDLFVRRGEQKQPAEDTFSAYGVAPVFNLHRTPTGNSRIGFTLFICSAVLFAVRHHADIIYTRIPRVAVLATILGQRAVLEIHHPIPYRSVRTYLFLSRRPLIVAITETLRQRLLADLKCDAKAIIVAPDGSDPMPDDTVQALPPSPYRRIRIGYLGHLYPGKGMEIIAQLVPRCQWADFEIVGGTAKDIAHWQSKLQGYTNAHFHGQVPHSRTANYLSSFDVALLPNQSFVGVAQGGSINISQWTSPLKAFEYMAAGLPIVASDHPNLREVFTHEHNALLCGEKDADAWTSALFRLKEDQSLRQQLGHAARSDLECKYSWVARAGYILEKISSRFGLEFHAQRGLFCPQRG